MEHAGNPLAHFLHDVWGLCVAWLQALCSMDSGFWLYSAAAMALVSLGGLMSGLTLGLLSMDAVDLEILMRSGDPAEQRNAAAIQPLLRDTHVLLVTLLLWNAVAMEALPLVIGVISTPIVAVLISVTLVLFFGEIIPQAVCSRYGLVIGAKVAWLVKLLVMLSYPVAYPVGKLLDFLLGPEKHALFRRVELQALMSLHGKTESLGGTLTQREINVVNGALDLTSKIASVGMTAIHHVYMLSMDDTLDEDKLQELLVVGHSRVPVYQHGNPLDIVGLLLMKEVLVMNVKDGVPIRSLRLRPLPCLPADTPMYDVLKVFQTGHSHMVLLTQPASASTPAVLVPGRQPGALRKAQFHQKRGELEVSRSPPQLEAVLNTRIHSPFKEVRYDPSDPPRPGGPVGIITVEDVIEELMQDEILDETDLYADNSNTLPSKRLQAQLLRNLVPSLKRLLSQNRNSLSSRRGSGNETLAGRDSLQLDDAGNIIGQ